MANRGSGRGKSADAAARRAAALRQNLRRRKQQTRSIGDDPEGMATRFEPLQRKPASQGEPASGEEVRGFPPQGNSADRRK